MLVVIQRKYAGTRGIRSWWTSLAASQSWCLMHRWTPIETAHPLICRGTRWNKYQLYQRTWNVQVFLCPVFLLVPRLCDWFDLFVLGRPTQKTFWDSPGLPEQRVEALARSNMKQHSWECPGFGTTRVCLITCNILQKTILLHVSLYITLFEKGL